MTVIELKDLLDRVIDLDAEVRTGTEDNNFWDGSTVTGIMIMHNMVDGKNTARVVIVGDATKQRIDGMIGGEAGMIEKDLIGKTIEKIDIDGYGIEIRFTDGTEFVYNASDAGYSSWDISKGGEVNDSD